MVKRWYQRQDRRPEASSIRGARSGVRRRSPPGRASDHSDAAGRSNPASREPSQLIGDGARLVVARRSAATARLGWSSGTTTSPSTNRPPGASAPAIRWNRSAFSAPVSGGRRARWRPGRTARRAAGPASCATRERHTSASGSRARAASSIGAALVDSDQRGVRDGAPADAGRSPRSRSRARGSTARRPPVGQRQLVLKRVVGRDLRRGSSRLGRGIEVELPLERGRDLASPDSARADDATSAAVLVASQVDHRRGAPGSSPPSITRSTAAADRLGHVVQPPRVGAAGQVRARLQHGPPHPAQRGHLDHPQPERRRILAARQREAPARVWAAARSPPRAAAARSAARVAVPELGQRGQSERRGRRTSPPRACRPPALEA